MKRTTQLLRLSLCLVFVGCLLAAHTWWMRPLKLNWFYDRIFLQSLLDSPMFMSSLELLDKTGWAWYSDKLDDFSIKHEDQQLAVTKKNAQLFALYESSNLQNQDKINWLVANYQFKQDTQQSKWRWHAYPVNPLFGLQSQLPDFLINIHAIENEAGARDYIARMNGFPQAFDDIIAGLTVREAKGLFPPRFAVEKTREQIKQLITPPASEHPIIQSMAEKMQRLPSLNSEKQKILLTQASEVLEKRVYPAYKKLDAHLQKLLKQPLKNEGVWAMPDGQSYYEFLIQKHTTTSSTAEELHQLGLSEVKRIGTQMDAILTAEQIPGNNRTEKIHHLAQREDQRYPDTEEGRKTILKDYQNIINEAEVVTRPAFGIRPQMGVEVQRVPSFSEKTAPSGYYQYPSLDGSRPGTFFTNLNKIESTPKFSMKTLAYHEAIPGHHLQIALQMKLDNMPFFRRAASFTAYAEGWALYAEQLAWEMGLEKNPLDNLGRLQAEMFRAVRLVVDTGMHAKHWSREQAIAYMVQETGMQKNEVTIEIERYLVDPGQALAYKVGMMKLLELRSWAQSQLGQRFQLAKFHDVVLSNGAVPLDVLTQIVKDWVQTQLH